MMLMKVFAVYDKVVGAFYPPIFCRSKGEAIRSFSDAANSETHEFGKHASDFVLMELGEWNDQSGLFGCGEPIRVIAAHECLQRVQPADEGIRQAFNRGRANGSDPAEDTAS